MSDTTELREMSDEQLAATATEADDGGTTDTHNITADMLFKYAGFSLHGSFCRD